MENTPEDVKRLEDEFKKCQKILSAIGDKTRQHLICTMLNGECSGSRVIDIAKRANLSRAAASHHMQILKSAGIVKDRKEGTFIYYYLNLDISELNNLITLFCDIKELMKNVPERSNKEL